MFRETASLRLNSTILIFKILPSGKRVHVYYVIRNEELNTRVKIEKMAHGERVQQFMEFLGSREMP